MRATYTKFVAKLYKICSKAIQNALHKATTLNSYFNLNLYNLKKKVTQDQSKQVKKTYANIFKLLNLSLLTSLSPWENAFTFVWHEPYTNQHIETLPYHCSNIIPAVNGSWDCSTVKGTKNSSNPEILTLIKGMKNWRTHGRMCTKYFHSYT